MPSCQNYFGKVFAHVGGALAIAAVSAETSDIGAKALKGQHRMIQLLLNLVISFVLIYGVMRTKQGGIPKYLFFAAFAFWMGQVLKPLVDQLQDKKQIERVLILTTGVFAGMAAVGFNDNQNLLGFGPYLLAALFGLILAQIGLAIFSSPEDKAKAFEIIRFLGVGLFAAFTAYDVQRIKRSSSLCRKMKNAGVQPDYPSESLGLFLDYVNLFSFIGTED